jgi:transcriptional regulator with XRE-family HTH domain
MFTFVKAKITYMKERLLEFLRAENKSSAQLAEEIGVQPSGISHIISGRNNPSLDFVLKMLEKYPFLSTDWLLFGKGTMYKDSRMQTLFENEKAGENLIQLKSSDLDQDKSIKLIDGDEFKPSQNISTGKTTDKKTSISRIVWFYDNNSFEEYYPR